LFFSKLDVFDEMESEIATVDEVHDEVEVVSVLEGIESVYQELILQTLQKIELIHD
jgi:hypothetical protein